MNYILSNKLWSVVAGIIVLATMFFATSALAASVWTPPPGPWPQNVDPPIHSGNVMQVKNASLGSTVFNFVSGGGSIKTDLFRVTIGQLTEGPVIADKFCFVNPLNNDFNTNILSPQNCITSWPTGGGTGTELWTAVGNNAMHQTDLNRKVGIGTASPSTTLHVNGNGLFSQYSNPYTGALIRSNASANNSYSSSGSPEYSFWNFNPQAPQSAGIGMFNPAPNELGFATGNYDRIRITGTTQTDGVVDIYGQIKIRGGNPALGKVLVSDAYGLATWGDASGLPTPATDNQTLRYETDQNKWVVSNLLTNGDVPPNPANYANTANERTIFIRRAGVTGGVITQDNGQTGYNTQKTPQQQEKKGLFAGLFGKKNVAPKSLTADLINVGQGLACFDADGNVVPCNDPVGPGIPPGGSGPGGGGTVPWTPGDPIGGEIPHPNTNGNVIQGGNINIGLGTNGGPLPTNTQTYSSSPYLFDARVDVPDAKGLVVDGTGRTAIDKLLVWTSSIFTPGPNQIGINNGHIIGDVAFDDNISLASDKTFSSWHGNFDLGGVNMELHSGASFQIDPNNDDNVAPNQVLASSSDGTGRVEWRDANSLITQPGYVVPDIKMVEGKWFATSNGNEGERGRLTCPVDYAAVAVSCDSDDDDGPDTCKLANTRGSSGYMPYDGHDPSEYNMPGSPATYDWASSASSGYYNGGIVSPKAAGNNFWMTVTCMRYK